MPARRAILESVYENADLAVFVVDVRSDGTYEFVDINPRHEEITGLDADWIRGRPLEDLHPRIPRDTLDAVRQQYDRCVREARPTEYEEKLVIDDRPSWWLTRLSPLKNAGGRIHRIVGTGVPITERRELEERLRTALTAAEQARADAEAATRAKSSFLAGVSHEIRTPLSSILGFVDLLRDTDLSGDQRIYADTLARSGRQLRVLLDNVLDLSKAEAGRIELRSRPFDLHALIGESVRQMAPSASKQGTRLTYSVAASVPRRVAGDPDRLRQILLNLLSNAIKYTADGRVNVQARTDAAGDGPDAPGAEGREGRAFRLTLEVEDTGVGIPYSERASIFDAFQQGSRTPARRWGRAMSTGVGLGLAITREIVDLMDGTIGLDSTVGEGSTFRVEIPLSRANRSARKRSGPRDPETTTRSRFEELRVLVVEDEPSHLYLTEQYLQRLGVEPDTAQSGPEALRLIRSKPYDVVLMDIGLPGLTGVDVTRQIRTEKGVPKQPRIIAATAQAIEGDRERFLEAGMDDHLSKPFDLADLATLLRRVVPR